MGDSANGRCPKLSDEFIRQNVEAERCCLAVGIYDPVGLHNAVFEQRLAARDFIGPNHWWLFSTLCISAEQDAWLNLWSLEQLAIADAIDRDADRRHPRFREWLDDLAFHVEFVARDLPMYCEAVRYYTDIRKQAESHWRKWRFVLKVSE